MSSLADPPTPAGAAPARPATRSRAGALALWPRGAQRLVAWVQDHVLPDATPASARLTDAHLDRLPHHRKERPS